MREENGRLASITTDHLGTPTEMYDEMGAPIWKARLDLFGVCTIERGTRSQCPFRWPGQYEDEETGLYYNRYRYYDPSEGVYVSQDPIRLAGGLALYGYVGDPLCEFDPYGLNKALGDFGERVARRHAQGMGHTIVGSVQNTSGHGIDLVTRDPSGTLHFWEVKVNSARMSRAQSGGATFIRSRLARALNWKSTHHPRLAAQARELLREIGGTNISGTVLYVRPGAAPSGRITTKKWC
jgi:RHS repeat-associated protein